MNNTVDIVERQEGEGRRGEGRRGEGREKEREIKYRGKRDGRLKRGRKEGRGKIKFCSRKEYRLCSICT